MFNIIVADSKTVNADLIADCLDKREYNIMVSESGSDIISKSRLFNPDLIISSVELRDMSGYDLCKSIKRQAVTESCLVLLINGVDKSEFNVRSLESGADDFMDMEFDAVILKAKVKSLLRIKTLSNQLKEKYKELEEKNCILDMQLEMSRKVQTSLVQKPDICIGDVKISNVYRPAIAIGGDFYDIIPVEHDKAAIIMGDVSGHGISSALITTMVLIMVRNLSDYYKSPDDLLYFLNNQFIEAFAGNDSEVYICVSAAFIDTSKMEVKFSNAGLTPPIYADGVKHEVIELNVPGMPIGMVKGVEYTSQKFKYNKDDTLLFYTDGLCDTFYKHSPDEFIRLMSELLLTTLKEHDCKKILNIILDEFYIKEANQVEKLNLDDVCAVLCRL